MLLFGNQGVGEATKKRFKDALPMLHPGGAGAGTRRDSRPLPLLYSVQQMVVPRSPRAQIKQEFLKRTEPTSGEPCTFTQSATPTTQGRTCRRADTCTRRTRMSVSQEKSSVRKRFREAPRETSTNTQFCVPGGSDPARVNHRVVPCTYFTVGNVFFQETERRTCLFKVYQTKHDGNICHRGPGSVGPRSAGAGDFGRRPPEASPEEVGTGPGHRRGREGDERGRSGGGAATYHLSPHGLLLRTPAHIGLQRVRGRRERRKAASDWHRETPIRRGGADVVERRGLERPEDHIVGLLAVGTLVSGVRLSSSP